MSRPARGGWIEIIPFDIDRPLTDGPVPRGAGGLKFQSYLQAICKSYWSRPARGGWIEMGCGVSRRRTVWHVPSREGRVD